MRLSELAQACGAKLEGNPEHKIRDVARIDAAGPDQLCFVMNKDYAAGLAKSRAGAVITAQGIEVPQGMNVLRAPDPDLAFSKAMEALRPAHPHPAPGVAPSALIGQGVELGEGCSIGAYVVIGDGAKIGKRVVIYPQCYIGPGVSIGEGTVLYPQVSIMHGCTIGKNCQILPGARIGQDGFGFHFVAGKFAKAPQRGTVIIEDDVEIGANTTIDRARFDVTRVRNGAKIDNLVQIGHNCNVGQHCVIAGQSGLAGSVTLQDYVQMGGNAGITPHVTIGMGAKIAAKTGVMKDIPPGMNVAGLMGDEGKLWMKREAAYRRLPETMQRIRELEAQVRKLSEQAKG